MEHSILYLMPVLFPLAWILVTTLLRHSAGMSTSVAAETTLPLRASGWGSGSVNGVGCRNCLKIEEHEDGYLLRTMWIFGNGKLWLPKPLTIGEIRKGSFLFPRKCVIISEFNRVVLLGSLFDFVHSPPVEAHP